MSKDMREHIDRVKNWNQFLNESVENEFINDLKLKDSFYQSYSNNKIENFLDYMRYTTINLFNELKINENIEVYLYVPILKYSKLVSITLLSSEQRYEVYPLPQPEKEKFFYDINYNQIIAGLIKAFDGKTDLEHLTKLHSEFYSFVD